MSLLSERRYIKLLAQQQVDMSEYLSDTHTHTEETKSRPSRLIWSLGAI